MQMSFLSLTPVQHAVTVKTYKFFLVRSLIYIQLWCGRLYDVRYEEDDLRLYCPPKSVNEGLTDWRIYKFVLNVLTRYSQPESTSG